MRLLLLGQDRVVVHVEEEGVEACCDGVQSAVYNHKKKIISEKYLELLPTLNSGVLVHVHDIFTPKDYLDEWVFNKHLLWNEQYLLEAFLIFNSEFRIIGSLNYLSHNFTEEFSEKCPVFAKQDDREPGAFWMIKK